MKNIKICSVDTVYTLFLYFLINGYDEKDIYIFSSGIPKNIRDNINHVYFPYFNFPQHYNKNGLNLIKRYALNFNFYLTFIYEVFKLNCILFFKTFNKNVEIYGHNHTIFGHLMIIFKNSFIIEDGLANYIIEESKLKNNFRDRILLYFGIYYDDYKARFGSHPNIKKVFLTNNNVPDLIKSKTEIIDITDLWNEKSNDEKNKILEIFNFKNVSDIIKDTSVLLLTQPFSEDGFMPLEEELEIYKSIVKENKDIIIKPHPREKKRI